MRRRGRIGSGHQEAGDCRRTNRLSSHLTLALQREALATLHRLQTTQSVSSHPKSGVEVRFKLRLVRPERLWGQSQRRLGGTLIVSTW